MTPEGRLVSNRPFKRSPQYFDMKKRHIVKAAFLNPHIFPGLIVFLAGVLLALLAAANSQALVGGDDQATAIGVDYANIQYVPEPTPTPTPTCTSAPWV